MDVREPGVADRLQVHEDHHLGLGLVDPLGHQHQLRLDTLVVLPLSNKAEQTSKHDETFALRTRFKMSCAVV